MRRGVIRQIAPIQTLNRFLNRFPGTKVHENLDFGSVWHVDCEYGIISTPLKKPIERTLKCISKTLKGIEDWAIRSTPHSLRYFLLQRSSSGVHSRTTSIATDCVRCLTIHFYLFGWLNNCFVFRSTYGTERHMKTACEIQSVLPKRTRAHPALAKKRFIINSCWCGTLSAWRVALYCGKEVRFVLVVLPLEEDEMNGFWYRYGYGGRFSTLLEQFLALVSMSVKYCY